MLDAVGGEDGGAVGVGGDGGRRPVLWVALGRQRVGKTALLSAAAQFFRARGAALEVWNADQQNRGHALSAFFPDASSPPTAGGIADGRAWIAERIERLASGGGGGARRSAVLDTGGGFTGFSALTERVPLAEALEEAGVRPVALFVVGPERADLDYLEHFSAEGGGFAPEASVLVFNTALVEAGRSSAGAFAPVMGHRAVRAAVDRGAAVATMPALGCLSDLADQGLGYEAALRGDYAPGQRRLGFLALAEVRRFWTRELPRFFADIPDEWLPCPVGPGPVGPMSAA